MEKLQERGLRFVYNDFSASYEDLLTNAKLSTLHIRRMRTMAIETFNILNSLAPPFTGNLLQTRANVYNSRYSNSYKFLQSELGNSVRAFLDMLPLSCGTLYQTILEKCSYFNQFQQMILLCNGKECKCTACNDI